MARSDLIVSLVKAGTAGDKRSFRSATEAIIAEERAKHHNVLADRLTSLIQSNGSGGAQGTVAIASVQHDPSPRGKEFIAEITPRRRLDDLILPAIVRRAVDELVEEQQRADLLRAHGLEPRHRVLLVGSPGTGKTTLAEAIAESAGVPLFVVRYETMIGSYLGETATRLKRLFDYARTTPCVLFFDEFDAIGKERGDIHETGEIKRVVTSLLMQVDDLPSYTILAAATNHPELLDRASWRRFQLRLPLPLPDSRALTRYIQSFLRAPLRAARPDTLRHCPAPRQNQLRRGRAVLSRCSKAQRARDRAESRRCHRRRAAQCLGYARQGRQDRQGRHEGWPSALY